MFLARIIGDVVSDHKIKDYVGLKMLVVQPIDPEGQALGNSLLAVDGYFPAGNLQLDLTSD